MKTNSTLGCKLFALSTIFFLHSLSIKAQCIAPAMKWENPVLVSGTVLQKNAVYKFPSVITGVDAFITVNDLIGGAILTSIDDNTYGYSAAWQPVVHTPNVQGISNSYVSFKIEFKDSSDGQIHTFPCFQLSFIDVDGDDVAVREFVAAKNPESITVSNISVLTISNLSGSMVQATGPLTNYVGLDTSSWATNINYRYANKDKVDEVWIGNVTAASFSGQDRYTCGFFQQISLPFVPILPVNYLSFDATAIDKAVLLKWTTENEVNNDHFEVERSFTGADFKTAGIVLDGFENGTKKNYMFKDNAAELNSKNKVYYRLKQFDKNGRFTYTNTLVVKLQAPIVMTMQSNPNPFIESVSLGFSSTENGNAEVNFINLTGQKIITKQLSVSKGYNTAQINGLANMAPGMYIAQLTINGVVTATQKIIKN